MESRTIKRTTFYRKKSETLVKVVLHLEQLVQKLENELEVVRQENERLHKQRRKASWFV